MLRIGTAQADITPQLPVLMGGAFLKFECREVHDPVMASCVVADDGQTRAAIVSCDLGSVSSDMLESIRHQVVRATATPGENLRVMATHNHSGPTVQAQRDNPFGDGENSSKIEQARKQWAYYKDHWDEFNRLDIEERGNIQSTLRLEGYRQAGTAEPAEISALALGDVIFIGNPAELFVEFQLDIKERFQGRKVIVTELTNGRISYVPTRLACALGGYETILTRFNPGTGELIRDTSCELIASLIANHK